MGLIAERENSPLGSNALNSEATEIHSPPSFKFKVKFKTTFRYVSFVLFWETGVPPHDVVYLLFMKFNECYYCNDFV